MRELNVNEIEVVGGGLGGICRGADMVRRAYLSVNWGTASYSDMMIAP